MSVVYPNLFRESVLPYLVEYFKEQPDVVFDDQEDRTCWYFKNRLVAISEGSVLSVGLVWIDDIRITTSLAMEFATWQQREHNLMIRRERDAAERIWKKVQESSNPRFGK